MFLSPEKLKKMLVEPGYLTEAEFLSAQKKAQEKKKPLEDILIDDGLIKDEELGQLFANEGGYPFADLRKEKIDENVFSVLPEITAKDRQVFAFARDKEGIKVGFANPDDNTAWRLLEKKFGQKIKPFLITKRDLGQALLRYKSGLKAEYADLIKQIEQKKLLSETGGKEDKSFLTAKIIDLLISYGHYNNASDIHIEPGESGAKIRFRIDGLMHKVLEIPKNYYEIAVSRIKILSKMRIDEHFMPQDGKFRFKVNGKNIDIRVSVVPVIKGENVVMRLLSAQNRRLTLASLGFNPADLKKIKQAIRARAGMILVAGPTGSGKTTTIYEIIKILNTEDVHISSIEDPVEYDIEGVSQIQTNPKANLTFATGLKAIVRQDPDIIIVGEIRDAETARIAVNSGLTGHLVLSTLHANDSATTLPRLLDMGIEPFLVASTVKIVIAQRLVRVICEKCRASCALKEEEKQAILSDRELYGFFKSRGKGDLEKVRLYRGAGCSVCAETGYSGRIGIFEVLDMSQPIKELVVKKASSGEILSEARELGMSVMMQDGMEKIFNGVTTLEELLRVIEQ